MVDLISELVFCLGLAIVILVVPGFLSSLLRGKSDTSGATTFDSHVSDHVGSDPH